MTGKPKPAVEIFSDAGVKQGVGAWAAVIVRRDGRDGIVEASGILRAEVGSDTERAEACAAANGFHKAKLAGLIEPRELVVIRCDNDAVVARWRFLYPPGPRNPVSMTKPRPAVDRALRLIRALAVELQCVVHFRGLKAHTDLSSRDRCALLNARADALCCQALGTKRKGAELVRNGVAGLIPEA